MAKRNVFDNARRANLAIWLPKDEIEAALARLGDPPKAFRREFRCGAHARTTGKPCQAHALENGRCKLHGGMSTGPRTAEGRERIAAAQRRRWEKYRAEKSDHVLITSQTTVLHCDEACSAESNLLANDGTPIYR